MVDRAHALGKLVIMLVAFALGLLAALAPAALATNAVVIVNTPPGARGAACAADALRAPLQLAGAFAIALTPVRATSLGTQLALEASAVLGEDAVRPPGTALLTTRGPAASVGAAFEAPGLIPIERVSTLLNARLAGTTRSGSVISLTIDGARVRAVSATEYALDFDVRGKARLFGSFAGTWTATGTPRFDGASDRLWIDGLKLANGSRVLRLLSSEVADILDEYTQWNPNAEIARVLRKRAGHVPTAAGACAEARWTLRSLRLKSASFSQAGVHVVVAGAGTVAVRSVGKVHPLKSSR